MGKPLKTRSINPRLRNDVLAHQGVKINKRRRLGHSSHFGKIEQVPIERKPSKNIAVSDRKSEDEEKAKPKTKLDGRMPGEKFKTFIKRISKETREMIINSARSSTKSSQKRKDFLNRLKEEKKEKKKAKKIVRTTEEESDLDDKEPDVPKFGEQANRPPIIKVSKPLKGLNKPFNAQPSGDGYVINGVPVIPELSGESKLKRQMEMLRQNAISQYRKMTLAKRQAKGLTTI